MDNKDSLERTKELSNVSPVTSDIPIVKENDSKDEAGYDEIKHNRLMMDFDAHEDDENSPKSIKEKKKIAVLLSIVILGMLLVFALLFFYMNSNDEVFNYKDEINSAIIELYDMDNSKNLEDIYDKIKNNEEQVKYLHQEILDNANKWSGEYLIDKNFKNYEEFNKNCLLTKNKIEKIYKIGEHSILDEQEYHNLNDKIDKIQKDGKSYYSALEKYNNDDYNESYHLFSQIEEENTFYSESQRYLEIIFDDVMKIIQDDVDEVSLIQPEDRNIVLNKLNKYISVYNYLDLGNNPTYQQFIQAYKE